MSPLTQAKVWALFAMKESLGLVLSDSEVAAHVQKIGPNGKDGGHPTKQATQQLRVAFQAVTTNKNDKLAPKRRVDLLNFRVGFRADPQNYRSAP